MGLVNGIVNTVKRFFFPQAVAEREFGASPAVSLTMEQQKEKEGELILKNIQAGDYLVLLDDKGKEYTSMQFASYIEKKTHTVSKRLIFAIGGPYGFSEAVYQKANEKLTLSRMTFSHQMVRLIFVEQLYRAMTILNNEPYHHE